jgi:hypothetical protein
MDRVGLVALRLATLLLVGASYGALWLMPYLDEIPSDRFVIGCATLFPIAILLRRRVSDAR